MLSQSLLPSEQLQPDALNPVHTIDMTGPGSVSAPQTRTVGKISEGQVREAQAHGQEVSIKLEDSKLLRLLLNFGFPVLNHFVSEGVKRWIEDYQGPMEDTSFGPYGNSIYDAAMPQALTVIEAAFLSVALKSPKFVAEQMFATAGAVGAGAFMEGLSMNSHMESPRDGETDSRVSITGREATRAAVGGAVGWMVKHLGMFAVNAMTAKKVVLATPEEMLNQDIEAPREQTFTAK